MNLSNTTALVTGGTGFIGGRLVETLVLQHGVKVRAYVRDLRKSIRLARFNVELIPGELTDADALKRAAQGCDYVFHCAFGATGSARQQRDATVAGTRAVIDAAGHANVKRLVHLSTLSVYGDLTGAALDENAPRRKTGDLYGDTKLEAEELVLTAHRERKLPVAVIQPTVVYGPFGGWWTNGQIERLRKGRFALPNGGDGVCNPVYVDDVVQSMLRAATSPAAVGEVFLVSGPSAVTWREYFAAIEQMIGRPSTVAMDADEIRKRSRPPRQPRTVFGWALQVLRERPDIRQRIVNSPLLGLPYRLASKLTPRGLMRAIKRRMLGESFDKPATNPSPAAAPSTVAAPVDTRPIIYPDAASLPQFTAKTRVLIDKARRLIGYDPRYDLPRGMAITSRWAKWADLLP